MISRYYRFKIKKKSSDSSNAVSSKLTNHVTLVQLKVLIMYKEFDKNKKKNMFFYWLIVIVTGDMVHHVHCIH